MPALSPALESGRAVDPGRPPRRSVAEIVALLTAALAAGAAFARWPIAAAYGGVALVLWAALRHGTGVTALTSLGVLAAAALPRLWPAAAGYVRLDGSAAVPSHLPVVALTASAVALIVAQVLSRERRRVERTTARLDELGRLVAALPDPFLRFDADGRVLERRGSLPTAGEAVPPDRREERLSDHLPEPSARALVDVAERTRRHGGPGRVEYELPGPAGPATFEARVVPLGEAQALALVRETTERKRIERTLVARAAELARANAELEQFAYVASHDLQEPLRTVASFCELWQRRYGGRLGAEADELIGFAVDGAKRMQSLVRDLLELSRVGTRGRPLVEVDCGRVVAEVVAGLRPAIESCGARIAVDPLPTVLGDAAQLGQLFANLIGNALKYRSEAPAVIRVTVTDAGEAWQVAVADNGIGIDPEFHERIFQIFHRLHGRDVYPGNGIGLALARKIVERHGGRIRVESRPGEGATFRFTLPKPGHAFPEDAGLL